MKKAQTKKSIKFQDGWCFATINGRLAEINFDKKYGIWGHCYVKREEYNRTEQKMIDTDIKKYQFIYRKGYYTDKKTRAKYKRANILKVFPEIRKYSKGKRRKSKR